MIIFFSGMCKTTKEIESIFRTNTFSFGLPFPSLQTSIDRADAHSSSRRGRVESAVSVKARDRMSKYELKLRKPEIKLAKLMN